MVDAYRPGLERQEPLTLRAAQLVRIGKGAQHVEGEVADVDAFARIGAEGNQRGFAHYLHDITGHVEYLHRCQDSATAFTVDKLRALAHLLGVARSLLHAARHAAIALDKRDGLPTFLWTQRLVFCQRSRINLRGGVLPLL